MRSFILGVLGCSLVLSAQAFYSASDDVVELNPSNFNKEVLQSDSLWLIEFYAPWCGHCQSLTADWKKAATTLKGIVKVGAVDADQHKSLGSQFGVKGFPTIKVFGANKNKPEDYQGGRTSQAIVDGAMKSLNSLVKDRLSGKSGGSGYKQSGGGGAGSKQDVVELTDDNFDKMVLQVLRPLVWTLQKTKGKVRLGAMDATVHQAVSGRYGIRGFPTIKIFRKGEEPEDYQGGRTRGDIIARALDLFSDHAPPPELLEILSEDTLKKTCVDSQLCVIGVLPHILDTGAAGRNGYLEVMTKMAEKYKKKSWGWLWTEAGTQMELEAALGIGGFGYPAMAAINSRKMKFALLRGSFSETGIHEFLRELSVGRGSTATLGNGSMPKVHTVAPWDGKDGQLPEEDDYDLSDVDLDDDDILSKTEL
ncbi:hypothetical protein JOQ06_027851 [Pogonophryne albipinna]|uniref:Protein disulfide-isomerase A6 n=1 Tax=Pogonophryne albipinna TaxID=1090488 RepID=A0AAD6ACE0_9TELE|nr:hypothetical protein JOQ06_027851 [Pogonophryne albipinna]